MSHSIKRQALFKNVNPHLKRFVNTGENPPVYIPPHKRGAIGSYMGRTSINPAELENKSKYFNLI